GQLGTRDRHPGRSAHVRYYRKGSVLSAGCAEATGRLAAGHIRQGVTEPSSRRSAAPQTEMSPARNRQETDNPGADHYHASTRFIGKARRGFMSILLEQ